MIDGKKEMMDAYRQWYFLEHKVNPKYLGNINLHDWLLPVFEAGWNKATELREEEIYELEEKVNQLNDCIYDIEYGMNNG